MGAARQALSASLCFGDMGQINQRPDALGGKPSVLPIVQNPAPCVLSAPRSIAQRALPLSAFGMTRGHYRDEASAVQMCAGRTDSIRAKPPLASIRDKEQSERVHARLQTLQYLQ